MPLVFGLGNRGIQYEHSRHNVGFDALQIMTAALHSTLKRRCFRLYNQCHVKTPDVDAHLIQPLTYMNRSGDILHYFVPKKYTIEDLIVICDNLDLYPGVIRIKRGGSSAGHNGLKSLIAHADSSNFIRIYVGIGRPEIGTSVVDHVLGIPTREEEYKAIQKGVQQAAEAALRLCRFESFEEVVRVYNKRTNSSSS